MLKKAETYLLRSREASQGRVVVIAKGESAQRKQREVARVTFDERRRRDGILCTDHDNDNCEMRER